MLVNFNLWIIFCLLDTQPYRYMPWLWLRLTHHNKGRGKCLCIFSLFSFTKLWLTLES